MFTGIVQERLTIRTLTTGNVMTVGLSLPQWGSLEIGESVLLHGICTTVTTIEADQFTVELMPETLQRTNATSWKVGDQIHAEPSATLQTKLSGNLVYGHVDAVAKVAQVEAQAGQTVLAIEIPQAYIPYVVVKGAITINGVNLTIVQLEGNVVTVNLIPHTANVTTLAQQQVGDLVNIELDYVTKVIVQTTLARLD